MLDIETVLSTRRRSAHPLVSALILHPREIQALWSQNYDTGSCVVPVDRFQVLFTGFHHGDERSMIHDDSSAGTTEEPPNTQQEESCPTTPQNIAVTANPHHVRARGTQSHMNNTYDTSGGITIIVRPDTRVN